MPDVEWKEVDGTVFVLKATRPGCLNSCIVRRVKPSLAYLWVKVTEGTETEFTDAEREIVQQLVTLGLAEEVTVSTAPGPCSGTT